MWKDRDRQLQQYPETPLNHLFDQLENDFRTIIEERKTRIPQEEIPQLVTERYRQDAADISFRWTTADSIERSIHMYLAGPGEHAGEEHVPFTFGPLERGFNELIVEVNAWKDAWESDGSGARHWHHEILNYLSFSLQYSTMKDVLETAYTTVSGWQEEQLKDKSPLQPFPRKAITH